MDDPLLDFFKTLCDANRLRLAGLLLNEPLTVLELADRLGLRPVEVTHHLSRLAALGLAEPAGDRWRIDPKTLETLSRAVLAHRRTPVAAHSNDETAGDFDRRVIKNYSLPDGRLREIPLQGKKLTAVLNHVVQVFEPGRRYTEKQVNEALTRFNDDYVTLRRCLIDQNLIERVPDGAVYWRTETPA